MNENRKDEIQELVSKINELTHEIKALKLIKLSLPSLESQLVNFKRTPQVNGVDLSTSSGFTPVFASGVLNVTTTIAGLTNFSSWSSTKLSNINDVTEINGIFSFNKSGFYLVTVSLDISSYDGDIIILSDGSFPISDTRIVFTSGAQNVTKSFIIERYGTTNSTKRIAITNYTSYSVSIRSASITIVKIADYTA